MIHRALSSIPSRPAFIIAPVIALVSLLVYFSNLRSECTGQAQFRVKLNDAVNSAELAGEPFQLASLTDFSWDHVKGFSEFEPRQKRRSCPFGWGWSDDERAAIIEAGQLSILLFFHNKTLVQFVEFRSDNLSIDNIEIPLEPANAIFEAARLPGGQLRLQLLNKD